MKSAMMLFVAIVAIAATGGCATPPNTVNAYDGPELPSPSVAILFTPKPYLNPRGFVVKVDDVGYNGYPDVVKLKPGTHTIETQCFVDTRKARVKFTAEFNAGHYYELHCRDTGEGPARTTFSIGSITTRSGKAEAFYIDRGKDFKLPETEKAQ